MNSGGLPPESQVREEHRQQALHVGLGGEGHGRLRPVVVEGGVEQALHGVGDRQRDAAQVAAPFELAHESAADGVQVGQQVADDQVHGQRLVELLLGLGLAEVQPRAQVPVDPGRAGRPAPSGRRRLLASMSASSFMSRRVISRPKVRRVGMTWARAVSMPIESWPKTTTRRPLQARRRSARRSTSRPGPRRWPRSAAGCWPVSGQVPTFRCASRPLWASAPLTAWAYTTPGFGPLLPQVMFTRRVGRQAGPAGSSASVAGRPRCPGVQITASTPGLAELPAHRCRPASRRRPAAASRPRPPGGRRACGRCSATCSATMPDDVGRPLARGGVDPRIARAHHAEGERFGLGFPARQLPGFGHCLNSVRYEL